MRRSGLVAPALYLALAFAMFASAWRDPTYLSVGTAGDPELYMWMLSWVPYSVTHGLNPFFTDFLLYPHGGNLLWSLIPIVPGFLLTPVLALFGPVAGYNLTMTLALALSAWCAYLVIARLVEDRVAAFVGGLIFGFSPYMLAHALGHPNLVICLAPPLVLWILAELLVWRRRPAWQPGLALGLVAGLQLLTTPEILFTTAFIGALGAIVIAALRWRDVAPRAMHVIAGFAVATVVFAVIAAYPLYFLYFGPQQVHGVVRQQDFFVTDLMNFVVPTDVQLIAPHDLIAAAGPWTGGDAEWNGYVGVPLVALLAFIAVRWRSSIVVMWSALVGAITAVLSLGPHLHLAGRIHFHIPLPWLALQRLPLFDNVLPARLMLFFYLVAGIAVAVFIRDVRRSPVRWRRAAGWLWVGASIAALLPAVPWTVTPNPVPAFFTGPEAQRIPAGSVALVAPFSTAPGFQLGPGQDSATYPMLWQLASGMRFKMPEGALDVQDVDGRPSGGRPPRSMTQTVLIAIDQGGPAPSLSAADRASLLGELRSWDIGTVIVGPMYNQPEMLKFFDDLFDRPGQADAGVYVWWDVAPDISVPVSGS